MGGNDTPAIIPESSASLHLGHSAHLMLGSHERPQTGLQSSIGKVPFMSSYKEPSFQERTALASNAKLAALKQLRSKPPVDEATLAERREAAAAKEAALAKARAEKIAARELEKAQKRQEAEERAAAEANIVVKTEEERKQERDARYAARKGRKGR